MVYHSHYLSKPLTTARNFRGLKNSHHSSELYCYFCMPPSRLVNFFPIATFCLKKKQVPRGTQKKKKELNRILCFVICLCLFLYIYVFFIVCILLFCVVRLVALFFSFPSLTIMLCIEYQVHHTWNSGAKLCREEENFVFWFGAQI